MTQLKMFDSDSRRALFRHQWNREALEQNIKTLMKRLSDNVLMIFFRSWLMCTPNNGDAHADVTAALREDAPIPPQGL